MKRYFSSLLYRISPPQVLALGFACMIAMGALLLKLPSATEAGESTRFIDALFTAASATCVTGLVVLDTSTHWSLFGESVIITLIQVGGVGFMAMGTLIALAFKRRISLKQRIILQESLNQSSMNGIVRLIRKVLLFTFVIEGAGALLLSLRFSSDMPAGQAVYYGIWHSISMFNNAGFDLFGSITGPFSSFTSYVADPLVNLVVICLTILGGIGFIVIADLIPSMNRRKLMLHTKIVLATTALLLIIGTIVIFTFEFTNPATLGPLNWTGKFFSSFFQAAVPRTAGPNTLDIGALRQASQFFIILLMFIGASPGSTGGGIKTTTFAVLIGAIIAMVRGKEDVVFFRSRLSKERVYKAITLTLLSLFIVIIASMGLSTTEDHSFLEILFEVTSAFSTVGLSMGLTPELTDIGKIMITALMFIGRLGPLTMAYALTPRAEKELYKYPEGKITIG